ncbi:MAG: DUF262 domain-containing protein [Leclercia adecarboxylata]|uniref:DUF262 domain-containing protein n=1 Tax=Leclercia adecarboxylata TaxID=83655 RepID=A0AAP9AK91_9ENTR|nr:DUF262 domain-containing protein [Leclercia adecarboxylata]MDK4744739.1 DUF262 domain-containing protein [Leclercia adecarboxylata]MDU1059471.1 DUF262 domain-containing protein [Leclercia adecarboxylata]MDU1083154.1 DUF262 domain-containing protein [Leclercia adecarboxylata]QDK19092.1 DUF262 domain-containing protein [Leclercia adecarboxylata]WJT03681.1 DUF262 domain-containing protein [Leclercia adecarboxylata]
MAILSKNIVTVKEALEKSLSIPDYQRPYKWREFHVNQLLEDIIQHRHQSRYRLGTIVSYKNRHNSPAEEIVDGQQRLLTLSLLCALLDEKQEYCSPSLLRHAFNNSITQHNVEKNVELIRRRLSQVSTEDQKSIYHYLLHSCELICVTLDNLSEAFQFFDSQNARGKPLEAYDLLKAFHLREMDENTPEERQRCVKTWENDVKPKKDRFARPNLDQLMSKTLYPLRCWANGEPGHALTKSQIHIFKGVSANKNSWRYATNLVTLDKLMDDFNRDPQRQINGEKMLFPFQIDQYLINGKRFFEYIDHYGSLYESLFHPQSSPVNALLNILTRYEGATRIGDRYVRNLFNCALFYYHDRFGDEELEKVAEVCFAWSYRLRLQHHRITVETIENAALSSQGLLRRIKLAHQPGDVLNYLVPIIYIDDIKGTKVDLLTSTLKEKGYVR